MDEVETETDVAETDVAETDVAETDVAETDVAETDTLPCVRRPELAVWLDEWQRDRRVPTNHQITGGRSPAGDDWRQVYCEEADRRWCRTQRAAGRCLRTETEFAELCALDGLTVGSAPDAEQLPDVARIVERDRVIELTQRQPLRDGAGRRGLRRRQSTGEPAPIILFPGQGRRLA
jgi:hypothetical protein